MTNAIKAPYGSLKGDEDELISAEQASAEEFQGHVSPYTINNWRTKSNARPLPFVMLGRQALYRRGDVRNFIAQNVTTTERNAQ